ncbi:MAG TPA: hypothetical protein PKV21_07740 [bacterium]|nr:hypothetical protein [bacterium]
MEKSTSEIQRSLGRIEGKLESLIVEVKENNTKTQKQIELLNEKINTLESFRDDLKGRLAIIVIIASIIGWIIPNIIDFLK